jgi:hypothetical protein
VAVTKNHSMISTSSFLAVLCSLLLFYDRKDQRKKRCVRHISELNATISCHFIPGVSNPRPAGLCFPTRGHICKFYIHHKDYRVTSEVTYTHQLEQRCEKWRSITKSQGPQKYPTNNKKRRKAKWIDHIMRRNCLLKRVIEGKTEGRIEVTGRRRRKQLPDGLMENRGHWTERWSTSSHSVENSA